MKSRFEAVIVNHNTSFLAEIALRSLSWSIEASGAADTVSVTIVDNHSSDATDGLRAAAEEFGAGWELSRWPAGRQPLTSHGDVLRDFTLARPQAAGFMYIDSDMCFTDPRTLATMVAELTQSPDIWAVQARQLTQAHPEERQMFRDVLHRRRRSMSMRSTLTFDDDDGNTITVGLAQAGRRIPRCHPGCTLIRNSEAFQLATRHLGLASAWTYANDPVLAGWNDTLGLVSNAMRTHRLTYVISEASVVHFWHGTSRRVSDVHRELMARLRTNQMDGFAALALAGLEEL